MRRLTYPCASMMSCWIPSPWATGFKATPAMWEEYARTGSVKNVQCPAPEKEPVCPMPDTKPKRGRRSRKVEVA